MSTSEDSAGTAELVVDDELPERPLAPLSDDRLKEIAATLGDLPALPEVALQAMRVADDPNWNLRTLDVTVRRDQALAARFLRLANSAFFGARCSITTLDRAINLVGITRVRSVLLAAALEGLHESKKSNFKGKDLWAHALAAGCVSQHLSTKHRLCDPEEAFMAGLLHDIGRPVMDHVFKAQYAEVIQLVAEGVAASFLSAEQRVFRFDHTDVGFVVVTAWAFPAEVAEAIRFHHDPTMAEANPSLCATVSLANSMCAKAELGPDKQPDLDLTALPARACSTLRPRSMASWNRYPGSSRGPTRSTHDPSASGALRQRLKAPEPFGTETGRNPHGGQDDAGWSRRFRIILISLTSSTLPPGGLGSPPRADVR